MSGHNENGIVVCGSGLAGLSAAVTALEAGVPTTVIEKAPEIGGTTVLSGGLIWTFRDYEKIRQDIPAGDPALQWMVHDAVADGRAWLADKGANLGPEESLLGHGWGRIMDPPQTIAALAAKFRELGGHLMLETALDTLVETGGAVRGIRVLRGETLTEMPAKAVVLATGGFQGNAELLARYVLPDPSHLLLRANRYSTGDGFLAATAIGAAASQGLSTFYGHALTAAPARYSKLEFRDVSQYYGQAAVVINLEGERFCDESEGTGEEIVNQQLARQPRGRGFYVIDHRLLDSFPIEGLEIAIRAMIDRARAAKAIVIEAPTLEDLCRQLAEFGVPEAKALRTLREFNAAIDGDRAGELTPSRRARRTALTAPPFYAVGVQAAITFTMGGLAIDDQTRVLRRSGTSSVMVEAPLERQFMEPADGALAVGTDYRQTPIRGLYAAGCDTGNISHYCYMGGLAAALTTGRIAGRNAAALAKNETGG